MTSWRNSVCEGDSIRDFIFDFGSGEDSTTVLPSHMLIEPCSFWAAAKVSLQQDPEQTTSHPLWEAGSSTWSLLPIAGG